MIHLRWLHLWNYLKKDGWLSKDTHTRRGACEEHVTWSQCDKPKKGKHTLQAHTQEQEVTRAVVKTTLT